jgi:hypothetical protein
VYTVWGAGLGFDVLDRLNLRLYNEDIEIWELD